MKRFDTHTGIVAVLKKNNVDTDQIIPKQFLTSIEKTGFGAYLFDSWRYRDEGYLGKPVSERDAIESFVLNRIPNASVLISGNNFGCGSSREHAAWALLDFGIQVVISPSFADIFYANTVKNGLLAITVPQAVVDQLAKQATQYPDYQLTIDLPAQTISNQTIQPVHFIIDTSVKKHLLEGLDDIALSLQAKDEITAFEMQHKKNMPWLFE